MTRIVFYCLLAFLVTLVVVVNCEDEDGKEKPDLLIATVATEERDGFRLFMRSVKKYGYDVVVFGMGQEWKGGTMETVGGGHKINLLKQGLKKYKNKDNLLIMFVDSYDVVLTEGPETLIEKFQKFDAKVVFSAEDAIWPDASLKDKYPMVKEKEKRFLNSGGFIGYAKEVNAIVNYQPIGDDQDDQLYYTKVFINRALRHEWGIKLDHRCEIFQNLNWALGEISLKYKGPRSYLYNLKTGTTPVVVHGNGPIKPEFYRLANYLADGWTSTTGCQSCNEDLIDLSQLEEKDYPTVLFGLFIESATPFIREFFERIANLDYPKAKIDIFIHNTIEMHEKDVQVFVDNHKDSYNSLRVIDPVEDIDYDVGRNWAIDECISKECQYFFEVDSYVQITKPSLLVDLIQQNRTIIAPLMKRVGKLWSNFWGALSPDQFYLRSEDYMDIVEYQKVGLWNVPHVSAILLVQGHRLPQLKNAYTSKYDPDMSFCQAARAKGMFVYVTNRDTWGHLVYLEYYETKHLNNELFDIFNNPLDWENRYIHKDYKALLDKESGFEQPCPDVYWFPIVTDTFCDEFVAELENYGQWSGGKNHDPRLATGYENVPTVDIHMKQVDLERQWLHFLQVYVRPLQEKVFVGYFHNPPHAIMNFIVRYRPDEQPILRPHHDASTYTINVALNQVGVDYEGGGCRFLRYNCSVVGTRKGWILMHPGRLTHYHEGLRTTKGTRYIMISFVDP